MKHGAQSWNRVASCGLSVPAPLGEVDADQEEEEAEDDDEEEGDEDVEADCPLQASCSPSLSS